jgi:hypothetical protein
MQGQWPAICRSALEYIGVPERTGAIHAGAAVLRCTNLPRPDTSERQGVETWQQNLALLMRRANPLQWQI